MATHDEAIAYKRQVAAQRVTPEIVPTWHTLVEPTPEAAVTFLNEPPAQGPGQAFASNRSDGQVDLYYFL
jgi:hypothetical protein